MKKTVISLTLLLSLLTTVGCSNSATTKRVEKDGTKVDVMYTYGENENVTADEVYNDLVNSTAGSKSLFDAVYKKVIEEEIADMPGKSEEIIKEVDEEMVTWLQDAKDQASDNGVSSDTMIDSLLEEEGVDSTEELTEKKIYEKQKKYVEDNYFDTYRNGTEINLVNEYVTNYFPMHIKGILVKVADTNYTYFARSITEDETDKLARTTRELIKGKEFNILAMDTNFSDHSTSQITTGGDLGIMDVTTSFNNEYKLGLYTYFAFGDNASEQALNLLTGGNEDLVNRYTDLYGAGFNVITLDQVNSLDDSSDVKKYADGKLVDSNTFDGDYKSLNLPRNVLYNNYFNSHKVSFLEAGANITNKTTVNCVATGTVDGEGNPIKTSKEVVANQYGYPILVLTDENGVQFISVEMDSFDGNATASEEYFGNTEKDKITVTLNGKEREMTSYFALAKNSGKTTRKEAVDTQVKNYINKGYGSSVSANQDFYYYRIYDEFIKKDANNLATLFGANYKTEGTKENTYYTQVTNYINAITTYRYALIQETIEDTGEAFAETLELQDSYIDANWVRPEWLAYTDETLFNDANNNSVPTDYESNVDYWNKNLGGGALYVK